MVFPSKKRRILIASEASFANTGFGRLYFELISRIHKTNKFDIAEFASFCNVNDVRDQRIKWKLYANSVTNDDPRAGYYDSNPNNKTGLWRFDEVLLDFRPDIVLDIRDTSMCTYQGMSVLREFFHWCICPTVDSAPQSDDFWGSFVEADSILTYTQYGFDTLKKGNLNLPLVKPVFFGVNTDDFHPLDKKYAKKILGLPDDKFIVGSVMRNQVRKLIPDLIKTIAETDDDTCLYLHTTYPDLNHWNIQSILLETGAYNKVYFSFMCQNCQNIFASKWQEDKTSCPHCNQFSAIKPKVSQSATVPQLNTVYNSFDMYVQYSIAEGLGVPAIEAAACGIPVACVNYSAMEDVINKLQCFAIPYLKLQRDLNTNADRAIPDNRCLLSLINDLKSKPQDIVRRIGYNHMMNCRSKFNWDKCADIFVEHLQKIELKNNHGKWWKESMFKDSPIPEIQEYEDPVDYVNRLLEGWLQCPHLKYTDWIDKLLYYFSSQLYFAGGLPKQIKYSEIIDTIKSLHQNKVFYEKVRTGEIPPRPNDFIEYAHIKEMSNL